MVNEADEGLFTSVDRCHEVVNEALGLLNDQFWVPAHVNVNCKVVRVGFRIVNDHE